MRAGDLYREIGDKTYENEEIVVQDEEGNIFRTDRIEIEQHEDSVIERTVWLKVVSQ